jgi:uncharacterized protein (TIGR03086 family)
MDSKKLFEQALEQANGCIKHVHADQLTNDTPCSEWDLRTLINHMVYELLWMPGLLLGKTIDEIGNKYDGDLLGEDIRASWKRASRAALDAVERADPEMVVHLSYGDIPAVDYIHEVGNDMCIHGWDVDQSTNCNLIIDSKLAKAIYESMYPRKEEMAASGIFGSALTVAGDATIQNKLLALYGRRPEQVHGAA